MEAVKMLAPASLSHIKMCSDFCQLVKVHNIEQFQPSRLSKYILYVGEHKVQSADNKVLGLFSSNFVFSFNRNLK